MQLGLCCKLVRHHSVSSHYIHRTFSHFHSLDRCVYINNLCMAAVHIVQCIRTITENRKCFTPCRVLRCIWITAPFFWASADAVDSITRCMLWFNGGQHLIKMWAYFGTYAAVALVWEVATWGCHAYCSISPCGMLVPSADCGAFSQLWHLQQLLWQWTNPAPWWLPPWRHKSFMWLVSLPSLCSLDSLLAVTF